MIDEKKLEEICPRQKGNQCNGHWQETHEAFDTLTAALRVVKAAQMLESHNAFCEGTKSYDAIHSSVHARMKDVREALKPFQRSGVSETNSSPGGKGA